MTIETILHLLMSYRYVLLFPLAAIEGPLVALVAGFMVSFGQLAFLPAYGIMILGDIIPDSFYYYVGRFGNQKDLIERYGRRFAIISKNFALAERMWRGHPAKTMFFGKLAYGLSIPFLISAGLMKMPYKRFLLYAVPVTLFQYGVITAVGYYLGDSYTRAEAYIHEVGIAIAGVVVLSLVGYILVSRFARGKIKAIEERQSSETPHD